MAQIFFTDDVLEEEVQGKIVGFTFDEQRKAKFGIKLTKDVEYSIIGYDYSANKSPIYLGMVVESDDKTGSVRVSSIEKQLSNLLKPLTETKTQLLDEIEELKSEIDKKELMTNFKEKLKKHLNSSSILKIRLKNLKTGSIKIGLLVSSIIFIRNIIRFNVLKLEILT